MLGSDLMKRVLISIVLILLATLNRVAYAAAPPPQVTADGAILIDANSGNILFEKNKDTRFFPASTTKIMTALLVLENCKLDDKVIVGTKPSSFVDGNKIYIFKDEEFTVQQLLYALLLESANDVAIALAEHVSGTEEAFASLMTERAKELGCKNTHFVNAHGLDDPNHYTTAYDLSLIAKEAMKNEDFRKIITTRSYFIPPTNKQPLKRPLNLRNNIVLNTKYHVDGADGIKTGYTTIAGHSFAGSALRGDTRLIVVLLHDKKPGLWEDAQALLNYGFDNFKTVKKVSAGDVVKTVKADGTNIEIPLIAGKDFYYTCPIDEDVEISTNTSLPRGLNGTIFKGQKLGYEEFISNGTKVGSIDLLAGNEMPATILHNYNNDCKSKINKSYSPIMVILSVGAITFTILSTINYTIKRRRWSK